MRMSGTQKQMGCREGWRARCSLRIERNTKAEILQRDNAQEVKCDVFSRKFRREGDINRHKCLDERSKPIREQKGATHAVSNLQQMVQKQR